MAIVRNHHERVDGKGFPDGLKGDNIPLAARIASVPDAFDAMTSLRPYRESLPRDQALQEIRDKSGTQFDPDIAELFLKIIEHY